MDKQKIKTAILQTMSENIEELKQSISRYDEVEDIDENATHDPEDYSHQTESGELKRRLEIQLQITENAQRYLNNLSLDTGGAVVPGALIVTDGPAFFYSLATDAIEIDGTKVVCFSDDAPIARLFQEKAVGDTIALGDNKYRIKQIL